ncbi:RimK family alpha-L-glutamate ligase [Luteibacter sp. CQ10]|uniref:RimK family alpha-L-glutamate ligase n=1 Tax=Luteibacter sp. CQ10 TaxID=2805821 RepID=UPI0034A4C68D
MSFLDTTSHESSEHYSYLLTSMDEETIRLDGMEQPDVVWRRRIYPRDPNPRVHASDRRFVEGELRQFERSILELIHHRGGAHWVNPPTGAALAENKLLQLRIAAKAGAIIPVTLVSRDPVEVKAFISEHGAVVVKPQIGHFWINDGEVAFQTQASIVSPSTPLDDDAIRVCPMIYQEKIKKVADIRVVKMGDSCTAIRMEQPTAGDARIDSRLNMFHPEMRASAFPVCARIKAIMDAMCDQLGIVYASCDFAQTSEGDLVFLDLNPAGQFMFLESFVPSIPIMHQFTNFLIGKKDDRRVLTIDDFTKSDEYRYWEAHLSVGYGNAYRPSHVISEEVA